MDFISRILPPGAVSTGLVTLAVAVVIGLGLGAIRIRGIGLGVAAVLFAGLAMGAMGFHVASAPLAFIRDFSLIIFVYAVGLQVGPGFLAAFRADGLRMNALMVVVVILGALLTVAIIVVAKLPHALAPGLYSGALSSTPAFAAGQEALVDRLGKRDADSVRASGVVFAVTYPVGVLGPIALIILMRRMFGVNVREERAALEKSHADRQPTSESLDFEVTQPELAAKALRDIPELRDGHILLTRLLRDGKAHVPAADTRLQVGDVIRAAGPAAALDRFVEQAGRRAHVHPGHIHGEVARARLLVTRSEALGKTLRQLDLTNRFHITVTQVHRAAVEISPRPDLPLQFADHLHVIGPREGIVAAQKVVGNSMAALKRPQLLPIFLGIVLGVIVGSIPISLPGLHSGIKIGLAGGPMLVAIALSRLGHFGSVVWYMPAAASNLFRDFGMALFLACTGLQAGGEIIDILLSAQGAIYIACGALITMLPIFLVALFVRVVFKMNFVTLSGLICGAMTSTPTMFFANDFTGSDEPAVVFASIYPLGMLIPVFAAQWLATALV